MSLQKDPPLWEKCFLLYIYTTWSITVVSVSITYCISTHTMHINISTIQRQLQQCTHFTDLSPVQNETIKRSMALFLSANLHWIIIICKDWVNTLNLEGVNLSQWMFDTLAVHVCLSEVPLTSQYKLCPFSSKFRLGMCASASGWVLFLQAMNS